MHDLQFPPLIHVLPPPQAIRERLGAVLREADLLRRLLRLAEQANRERERRQEEGGGRGA